MNMVIKLELQQQQRVYRITTIVQKFHSNSRICAIGLKWITRVSLEPQKNNITMRRIIFGFLEQLSHQVIPNYTSIIITFT